MSFWSTIWPFGGSGDKRQAGRQGSRPPAREATRVTFDTAMTVSAVWASARLLAEVIAAMPLRAYTIDLEKGTKTPTADNALWKLMAFNPNRYQTGVEFWENIVFNLVMRGNAYVVIERLGNRIVSLLPLSSAQMEPYLLDDGSLVYEYATASGGVKVYAPESVWHIKIFGNGIVGLSPLAYAANAIGTAQNLQDRVRTLSSNGGKSNGILTVDSALTKQQREQVKENFKDLEQGPDAELFVLEAGFKYQQTSLSPSDMQLIENRRFQIEDIARFFGVPSVLINDTSATTTWGSGIEQITQGFYKLNLRPYLERIESSIQRWLMPQSEWGKQSIEFDFDALLRADKATRIDAASKGVNAGILTPNEARADEGLKAQEGGDKIYLNGTLVPAGTTPQMRGTPNAT